MSFDTARTSTYEKPCRQSLECIHIERERERERERKREEEEPSTTCVVRRASCNQALLLLVGQRPLLHHGSLPCGCFEFRV